MDNWLGDQTVLITGATSGIGKQAAIELAKHNTNLVFLARNLNKAKKTKLEIIKKSGNEKVNFYTVDLSSLNQIREFASKFTKEYHSLKILINNAGMQTFRRQKTENGYEKTFTVNHLAYFLLTNLLLDKLIESRPSRIVNVSSGAHWKGKINFEDINFTKSIYNGVACYNQSKLANVMFTFYLADLLKDSGVIVNCLHPGKVRTNILKVFGLGKIFWKYNPFNLSPENGSETIIYLATSNKINGVTGKYFVKKEIRNTSPISKDKLQQEKLWKLSEEMVKFSIT
ncbi:MAG: SDR family oxidoreductase [Candidatus Thorarchaeota archaeon]